jgi:tRNA-dihydrouridine synthase
VGGKISGVLVGRGVLRNPWILAQASDLAAGRAPRTVTQRERGEFLHEYIDLLLNERVNEADGFRHVAPSHPRTLAPSHPRTLAPSHPRTLAPSHHEPAVGRERWVINKLRALCAWYSKGLDGGSHLRVRVNSATSIAELRGIVDEFFVEIPAAV